MKDIWKPTLLCFFFCNFPESLKLVENHFSDTSEAILTVSEHPCQKVNELSQGSQSKL